MGMTPTSSIIVPQHWEHLIGMITKYNPDIIDVISGQRWHRLRVHRVYLDRYRGLQNGIEMMQAKIEAVTGQHLARVDPKMATVLHSFGIYCRT